VEATIKTKKLKLDEIRILVNDGLTRPVLQCPTADFKKIVGEDLYDELEMDEKIKMFGTAKREKEGLIDKLKGEVESLGAKIVELTVKQKEKPNAKV
jgi:hypothetical protein